jgi:hypothetical protein
MSKQDSQDPLRDEARLRRRNLGMLLLSLLMLFFICVVGALLMVDALHGDRKLAASATGVLSLIALGLWMRVVRNRWLLLRLHSPIGVPSSEETGIWGVGGPGMRNPTMTGIQSPFQNRRSTDSSPNDPYKPP